MRIEPDQLRTLLIIVALAVVFAGAGWLPQHRQRQAIGQRIIAAQSTIAANEAQSQSLDRLTSDIRQLGGSLAGTADRIPAQGDIGSLLRDLSLAMTRQGLDDQQIVAHSITPGSEFSVIPLTLQFKGGFTGVFGLVREVESMQRLVRLTRVELTSDPNKGGEVTASLELCTFFSPQTAREAASRDSSTGSASETSGGGVTKELLP